MSTEANPYPSPRAWTDRGRRTTAERTPLAARSRTVWALRPRPPMGPSVGVGSCSVEARPGTAGGPEAMIRGLPLPPRGAPQGCGAVGGRGVLCGRGAPGHGGCAGGDDQWPAASLEGGAEGLDGEGLLCDRLRGVVDAVAVGEVAQPVGLSGRG